MPCLHAGFAWTRLDLRVLLCVCCARMLTVSLRLSLLTLCLRLSVMCLPLHACFGSLCVPVHLCISALVKPKRSKQTKSEHNHVRILENEFISFAGDHVSPAVMVGCCLLGA